MPDKPKKEISQSDAFIAAARALGCDDSEDDFNDKLKKVTSAPPETTKKRTKKKPAK